MNADQLDRLARRFATTTTRREAFGLGATILGFAARDEADARPRPCPPCPRRRRGRCRPQSDGATCAECAVCNAGACDLAPDDTPCRGDGRCSSGRCFARPSCQSVGTLCHAGTDCCSGVCNSFFGGSPLQCFPSAEGDPCLADTDCQPYLTCVAYACRA